MIAYLDSSVVLRVVLGQPGALPEWGRIRTAVGSGLVEVECLRTLDRMRFERWLTDEDVARRREAVYRIVERMEVVEPSGPVLRRAAQPMPTPLGTLDALHLATALIWRELRTTDLVMSTHDRALATAARASGLQVLGDPG
ncbi:MAG: type II toxin-antitoxin system VapC family toxin [Gemmatimonadales bacterium]